MTTGQRIQQARKAAGLSQKQLGERLGLSASMIGQWENDLRNPKHDTLQRIAKALLVRVSDLMDPVAYDLGFQEGSEAEEWLSRQIDELREQEGYTYSDRECDLIKLFSTLNDTGQQKAIESVEIIAGNPKYQDQEKISKHDTPPEEIDWWTPTMPTQPPPAPPEGTDTPVSEPPPEPPEDGE